MTDGADSAPVDSRPNDSHSEPTPPDDSDAPPTPADGVLRYWGESRILTVTASTATILDPESGNVWVLPDLGGFGAGSRVVCSGTSIWILDARENGEDDRVIRVDPVTSTVLSEWSLGPTVRPTDIVQVGDAFWITSYAKARIYLADSSGLSGSYLNLSDYADTDEVPEAMGALNLGDQTLIVLARQDQATGDPAGARLLFVDNNSYGVVNVLSLAGNSPGGAMHVDATALYLELVSTRAAGTAAADGGIEKVDLKTLTSAGVIISDATDGRTSALSSFARAASVVWRGFSPSTGGEWAGAWSLADGSPMQSFPLDGRPMAMGVFEGTTLWVGENGLDNVSGALVSREAISGAELTRSAYDGPIVAMAICPSELR